MKISILNGQVVIGNDLSRKGAEVVELSESDEQKIRIGTHTFDIESREIVEVNNDLSVEDKQKNIELQNEQERIQKIQKLKDLISTKTVLEILSEDTTDIDIQIQELSESYVQKNVKNQEERQTILGRIASFLSS